MPKITMEEVKKGIDYSSSSISKTPLMPQLSIVNETKSVETDIKKEIMKRDEMPENFKKIIHGFITGFICITIASLAALILAGTFWLIRLSF